MGDFGILLHSGFSRKEALLLNLAVSLTNLLGVLLGLTVGTVMLPLLSYALPFIAGTFLYIAAADMVPVLMQDSRAKESVLQIVCMLAGMLVMGLLLVLEAVAAHASEASH